MKLINEYLISENLKFHINNGLSISDCIFRIGSDSYISLINEIRNLYGMDVIELNESDRFLIEKLDTGKYGMYKGKKVELDLPRYVRDSDNMPKKKYVVFRKREDGKKDEDGNYLAVRIGYGHPDYKIKNNDPESAKNYRDRHKCDENDDMYSAGWWSCYAPKYFSKQLGLVSDEVW